MTDPLVTQDNSVLIVSDRPQLAALLCRAVENVLACRCIEPREALPAVLPLVAVVDITGDARLAAAWIVRLHGARIASLELTNRPPAARGRAAVATRTLPADAPRTAVLATLFALVDAWQAARRSAVAAPIRKVRDIAERARAAVGLVAGAFEAAEAGRPVSAEGVDAGTELILAAVSDSGIRTWLDVIQSHDQQLYQHSLSVAGYAAAFGAGLRLARADQKRLAQAALLHDVGKAKIPLAILNKPGRLTAEEMAVMRTHPAVGADLLAAQGGFDAATLAVVRSHHEMLDGSGYPDGLAGAAIPDLVRLVTICDIHSALTERRPYRDPLPHGEAHALMQGMVPKLDADLLAAFRRVVLQGVLDDAVV
ncbi:MULTISPECIES: HD domain-containing phosphohydrolase [unclassified Methylobacterium]|uniref:HD-GYP domain-containing protein n=1 Tax=unclassified Methylobacterium TaxID=2615210 RepID=UPI001FCCD440|nr:MULTISPECIES: HD domain-containing phosphohydrolase [unclassified Methylobacterium]